MVTGVLSAGLLGHGVIGVQWWEGAFVEPSMVWGLAALPGMVAPLMYLQFLDRRSSGAQSSGADVSGGQFSSHSWWPAALHTLVIPVLIGLIIALIMGLEWVGFGVMLSVPAYVLPIGLPSGRLCLCRAPAGRASLRRPAGCGLGWSCPAGKGPLALAPLDRHRFAWLPCMPVGVQWIGREVAADLGALDQGAE